MIEKSKLGVGLFLASEANFFLLLIFAYVYYPGGPGSGPTAASSLDAGTAGLNTVCLLSSSATMWRAEHNLERGNAARLCGWLLATVVLGAIFLIGQGREYVALIMQNVTVSRDLFGTTFFTLTGFHGLHVLVGLVALTILLGLALAGDFTGGRSVAVEAVALYWHFVDAVWIVIFSIVYVWARV
jgi:heme/copper-type cytochrome/quinol oxidase subunit 3